MDWLSGLSVGLDTGPTGQVPRSGPPLIKPRSSGYHRVKERSMLGTLDPADGSIEAISKPCGPFTSFTHLQVAHPPKTATVRPALWAVQILLD
jgi:hypothetical protein